MIIKCQEHYNKVVEYAKKYRRQYLTTMHRTIATVGKELEREI